MQNLANTCWAGFMIPRFPQVAAVIAITWAIFNVSQAQAERGEAPEGATGFYLSLFGGYVYQDAPRTLGFRTGMGLITNTFVPQDGGFVGGDLGYILGTNDAPFGLKNTRIEFTFNTNVLSDDGDSRFTGGAISSVDGTAIGGSAGFVTAHKHSQKVFDGSIALKGEMATGEVVDLTTGLEFFVRSREDKLTSSVFSGGLVNNLALDAWYFGTMAAIQPEFKLGNGLTFATEFAAGVYVVDSDGAFTDNFGTGNGSISDSRTSAGFRGRLGGALKASLANNITASVFGVVNYWSDVAHVVMADRNGAFGVPTRIGSQGATEAKVGARLTIAFGGD